VLFDVGLIAPIRFDAGALICVMRNGRVKRRRGEQRRGSGVDVGSGAGVREFDSATDCYDAYATMGRPGRTIQLEIQDFDAVIFDMDGVVTDTARLHAAAWKTTFDDYLRARSAAGGAPFQAFDADVDYRLYVDGKARADGVRSFLASRGIELADGTPRDGPEVDSVHGLGKRKNRQFLQSLQRDGVKVFETTLTLLRRFRACGLGVAIISASENCRALLERAGIEALFDIRVDGLDCRRDGIAGKPAPDIFLAAAAKLEVPARRAVVVEDAIAGVQAGRAGDFGLVIAIDRSGHRDALREAGADVVVDDLAQVDLTSALEDDDAALPSALKQALPIGTRVAGHKIAVFLDYDGTLTPIVDRPEQAAMSAPMRATVARLGAACPVTIISGRALDDVRAHVGLDGVYYSGSHGFEIAGPGGLRLRHPEVRRYLPMIGQAAAELDRLLRPIAGALVEDKHYTVAVHYRLVSAADQPAFDRTVEQVLMRYPELHRTGGKKVYEIRPPIDWDKGKAVQWLMAQLGLDDADVLPIYIGDDVTDEDAFRALAGRGLTILVGPSGADTAADYRLNDPDDVGRFLARLARLQTRGV
jgi:trehalose 6-phosphate phosphatase